MIAWSLMSWRPSSWLIADHWSLMFRERGASPSKSWLKPELDMVAVSWRSSRSKISNTNCSSNLNFSFRFCVSGNKDGAIVNSGLKWNSFLFIFSINERKQRPQTLQSAHRYFGSCYWGNALVFAKILLLPCGLSRLRLNCAILCSVSSTASRFCKIDGA